MSSSLSRLRGDSLSRLDGDRYEILPFGSPETDAASLGRPLTLTVTCSPRKGIDVSLDVGCRLRQLGHRVVLHLAARMVRDGDHLDRLLERMAAAGIGDVFLIGGDASEPLGEYESALDLLPELRVHPLRPRSIGVGAYPEGHPLIDPDSLFAALSEKAAHADYMTTQLCFDPEAILRWLTETRASGIDLPVYLGLPGLVDHRRLLEISLRVGVGTSLSFLRKQHGLLRFLARRRLSVEHLYAELSPLVGSELRIAGFHFFTFNRLSETVRFAARQPAEALATESTRQAQGVAR